MPQTIGMEVRLDDPVETAIEKVTEALQEEGFGVLTTIDVRATLKEKLGEEFRPYVILGACNPSLAHRALSRTADVGLLLPCNVTVEQVDGGSRVSLVDPHAMMSVGGLGDDEGIRSVAEEAAERLRRVVKALEG